MKTTLIQLSLILFLFGCSDKSRFIQNYQEHNNSLYREIIPSVYEIIVDGGHGTGWSYGDGYIVTNKHVTDSSKGAESTILVRDAYGVIAIAEMVGESDKYDISVVKLQRIQPVDIPLSKGVAIPGDLVYAFGSPNGLDKSMTSGIVSGPDREEFVLHSAGIGPGSSGGPLVNYNGHLVGMNTMVLNSPFGIDMGFAIKSEILEDEIERIIVENE